MTPPLPKYLKEKLDAGHLESQKEVTISNLSPFQMHERGYCDGFDACYLLVVDEIYEMGEDLKRLLMNLDNVGYHGDPIVQLRNQIRAILAKYEERRK